MLSWIYSLSLVLLHCQNLVLYQIMLKFHIRINLRDQPVLLQLLGKLHLDAEGLEDKP
jgi:hypothetical protein